MICSKNTWEPVENLDCPELIKNLEKDYKKRDEKTEETDNKRKANHDSDVMAKKKTEAKFCRGDAVWGKIFRFPWWPAIVIDARDCGRDNTKDKLWLFWFGDHKVSEISCDKVEDFKEEYQKHFLKGNGKNFISAVEELLIALAQHHNQHFPNSSGLFKWASDGFNGQFHFLPNKVTELPDIVLNALQRDEFQRKCSSASDDDVEKLEKIESLVPDVLKGVKNLEDICISCCKPNVIVVMRHPWFVGGVCRVCKKNVQYTCKTSFGCSQNYCCICGQGGTLIVCSNLMCLRSYCNLCIEYLAPRNSYKKILLMADWYCYLCKSDSRTDCLIIPRKLNITEEVSLIPVPEAKLPINVIAHSDTILSILREKKFSIGEFATQRTGSHSIDDEDIYDKDFTENEFRLISADLVCGCYLKDPTKLEVSNEDAKLFFADFNDFLFRLVNARLVKSTVFFVYIHDGKINNYLVESRVTRFLQVKSIAMKSETKLFYLYSNIPNCSSLTNIFKELNFADDNSEVHLFGAVFELILKYFKLGSRN